MMSERSVVLIFDDLIIDLKFNFMSTNQKRAREKEKEKEKERRQTL
jgi:hypothetical protein